MRKQEANRRAAQRRRVTRVVSVQFDACDVYIGRDIADDRARQGDFGNPYVPGRQVPQHYKGFKLEDAGEFVPHRAEAIARHDTYLRRRAQVDKKFRAALLKLRGLDLGCWCKGPGGVPDVPCHGDNIVRLLKELK